MYILSNGYLNEFVSHKLINLNVTANGNGSNSRNRT